MELNDTLRVPLAPAVVRDALEDLALLRASFDHCESFAKLAHGEFALTITVPLGRCARATTCARIRPASRTTRGA
jgi:carbon monoxide dehydrogenase subunit G